MTLISIMILAASWGLAVETYHLVLHGAFDTLDHKAFQAAFGMIMTLLIAIEFNHTNMHVFLKSSREIIVKTVAMVSILAVARQFIVFEIELTSPLVIAALAFLLVTLSLVYWIIDSASSSKEHK